MKRTIIKIDEEKCTGCGLCVSGCHEGALQLVDGKARMISELFCDGLGACIGDCPEGAIELEEREAEAYDETATIARIAMKGENTVLAHLNHLIAHDQKEYVHEALDYLKKSNISIDHLKLNIKNQNPMNHEHHSGCPGSMAMDFREKINENEQGNTSQPAQSSELRQWPVQLHLLSPVAPYFKGADVLLAADCTAFSMGNFHRDFLKGKSLAIACPKLDSNKEVYVEKITSLIEDAKINTLTVLIMEVPCCGGLLQMAKMALQQSTRKIPIKLIVAGLQGNIVTEEWL